MNFTYRVSLSSILIAALILTFWAFVSVPVIASANIPRFRYNEDSIFLEPINMRNFADLGIAESSIQDPLNIYFINVGEGDSIFFDCGSTEVLIDGGEKTPGVVNFIQPYVQGPIEDVVATHMDADHIGGLTACNRSRSVTGFGLASVSASTA